MSNALIDCLRFVPDDILPNFCDISAACFFFFRPDAVRGRRCTGTDPSVLILAVCYFIP